jgi:hypothetical protein
LFFGSVEAGQRSAVIYTLIENCRMHGAEPYAYLKDVLEPSIEMADGGTVLFDEIEKGSSRVFDGAKRPLELLLMRKRSAYDPATGSYTEPCPHKHRTSRIARNT